MPRKPASATLKGFERLQADKLLTMREQPRRPLRYWSLYRADKPERPSILGGVVLALCALFLSYMAVWMVIHPEPDNAAGDIILDLGLVFVAVWVDRHTIRRWREIRATAQAGPLGPN